MPPTLRLGVVDKGGAAMTDRTIVYELDLARHQVELDRQVFVLENIEYRGE